MKTVWDTRKGWIMCLNKKTDVFHNGAPWSYVQGLMTDDDYEIVNGQYRMETTVRGHTWPRNLHLSVGDGFAFRHGKTCKYGYEADVGGSEWRNLPRNTVKPYQITLVARLFLVEQNDQVIKLGFETPIDVFDAMMNLAVFRAWQTLPPNEASLLTEDDDLICDIETSAKLSNRRDNVGGSGTYFQVDQDSWETLLGQVRKIMNMPWANQIT